MHGQDDRDPAPLEAGEGGLEGQEGGAEGEHLPTGIPGRGRRVGDGA